MGAQTTIRRRTSCATLVFALAAALLSGVVGSAVRADAAQLEVPTAGWSTDGIVWDMVRIDDTVYIGGEFSQIQDDDGNVLLRTNLAAFDVATGAPLNWAPTADAEVKAMEAAADGSRIYIGGNFHRVNDRYRQRMAAVDPNDGSTVSSFRANTSGRVLELLLVGDDLYVAGELISIDGKSRDRIARVDARSGELDTEWKPSIKGGSVRGLEASPDQQRLYIAGTFDSVDWVARTAHLAAIELPGDAVDYSWRPDLDQPVFDVLATEDDVYLAVAGPGFPNNRLQKHSATTAEETLRYLADGDVQDLELRDNILFVGGHFEQVFGGMDRSQLAAIDITDDHITGFAPEVVTRYGVWKALAGPEGLWLGGEFTEIGGKARQGYGFLPTDDVSGPTGTLLLPRGSQWRYSDSGHEPTDGTQWTVPSWNDWGWKIGRGEFGFGDGDERTTVRATDALYARTTVDIADPAAFDGIAIRVLADAGAAVYVNGNEVARNNLPTGPLDGETLALEGRWTNGERTFTEHLVSPSKFSAGDNTIAVEVHGAYDWPGDLSFELEMLGLGAAGDEQLSETLTAVERGAIWRYRDDGSRYEADWTDPGFDDADWPSGQSELGFGDNDENTVLASGNTGYRFRHNFDLADVVDEDADGAAADTLSAATIRLRADDGAAIYLNGTEVVRHNLPADSTIGRWTEANDSVWGESESLFRQFDIDPGLIIDGLNTVAVTVHNVWSGGNDLSFDMELTIERPLPGPDEPQEPEPPVGPLTMVPGDADWMFLDDGSNPGTQWMDSTFDSGSWPTGAGRFGFGDGGETTLLAAGHESYYFRRHFTAPAIPDELTLNLRFDDGAVVYLNGVEAARLNLPDGPIKWWTTAVDARWGVSETVAEPISIDPALLVQGQNILAISVRNQWTGNADLSMDAELIAVYTEVQPDPDPDPDPDPEPVPWTPATLIEADAEWRFEDSGTDLGQQWTEHGFVDGDWSNGRAILGFGEDDEATPVTPWNKTYYFRKSFTVDVTDPDGAGMLMPTTITVRLLVDDGAAVYLNGTELLRHNLPAGPLAYNTTPLSAVWGNAEREYTEYQLPADLLQPGVNLLAVQAHNYAAGNSDFSFGLELAAD
ncbi:MAG: YncE family protein [Acidimicrobiales bacterium]